jgi:hypothetical protein
MTGRPVSLEAFRQLNLHIGTVLAVEPLLDDLAAAQVDQGQPEAPTTALVPRLSLPADAVGSRVVVATGLSPLTVAGRTFTAVLLTVDGLVPLVEGEIPNGSPLS